MSFARLAVSAPIVSIVLSCCAPTRNMAMNAEHAEKLLYGSPDSPDVDDGERVRFAAIGDMGMVGVPQAAVARGVAKACNDECDFALFLGDNLYDVGIRTAADEEDLSCLLDQYPEFPKYLTLGNHDYDKLLPKLSRAANQLEWIQDESDVDAHGGYHFYRFSAGCVDAVAIDTNFLVRGQLKTNYDHVARFLGTMRPMPGRWSIAFGHHPYHSNGSHGDAGHYRDGGMSFWTGEFFRNFTDLHVLDRADLYLAGHDHNLQFFPRIHDTDTAQVLSGSGAKCSGPVGRSEGETTLEHYGHGFALVDAAPDRLEVTFHAYDGKKIWGTYRTRDDATWRPSKGMPRSHINRRDLCTLEKSVMMGMPNTDEMRACM